MLDVQTLNNLFLMHFGKNIDGPGQIPGHSANTKVIVTCTPPQIASTGEDCFNLSAAVDPLLYKTCPSEIKVIRRKIPWDQADMMSRSEETFLSVMRPLYHEMVLSMKQSHGFSANDLYTGTYGTFERPGDKESFFRENLNNEDEHNVEIRLYANCQKAEIK